MENATKALLIAAAVLIVILIIALGMRIFNSTSDTTEQAKNAGKSISNQTSQASSVVNGEILVSTIDFETYRSEVKKYLGTDVLRNETTTKNIESSSFLEFYNICKGVNPQVKYSGPDLNGTFFTSGNVRNMKFTFNSSGIITFITPN